MNSNHIAIFNQIYDNAEGRRFKIQQSVESVLIDYRNQTLILKTEAGPACRANDETLALEIARSWKECFNEFKNAKHYLVLIRRLRDLRWFFINARGFETDEAYEEFKNRVVETIQEKDKEELYIVECRGSFSKPASPSTNS